MKRIWILMLAAGITGMLQAQNEVDALRYSQLNFGGTARFNALAGAFGALGADFSTLSVNPAGIGVYQTSEFSFTPSLYVGNTESSYLGKTGEDLKYNFNLGNAGMVFVMPMGPAANASGWKNLQFGLGINRHNNYNSRMLVEGFNAQGSMLDAYVNYANGMAPDELNAFDTRLAFNTWLLDTLGSETNYFSAVPGGNVTQRKSVTSDGSLNEFVLSMGANYSDRFYLGASLGFPFIRYYESSVYSERDYDGLVDDFNEFNVYDNLEVHGSGVNFKLGMIFRATDWLRLGAALHTPTFFDMQEEYSTTMNSSFDNGDSYEDSSPEGRFDYTLETPMRAIGSVAIVLGKLGLISADYEFVDYSSARLRSDTYKYFDENDAIRNSYTATGNLRVGTEWKLDNFSLRGGVALHGSPYESSINDGERTSYTFGFGLREKSYFVDFAYVRSGINEDYYLYDPALSSAVANKHNQNSYMMTLGFRF
ncbi:MAG: outer membrane protein transport protein [Bacteroidales bacterium]|nr:outer membrane protein transport protein [Bacteroidales bacterium]